MTNSFKRWSLIPILLFVVATVVATSRWHATEASVKNAPKRPQSTPTFNKEVLRIMQTSCQSCHHPGDIAPFSLMTYKDARPWAAAIREQVLTKQMPPWKPQAGCGDFTEERALTQSEINTIVAWVDGGAPEGAAADAPAPLTFSDVWPQGEPDFVADMNVDYTPPQGKDTYRCFSVPASSLRGDRYIQGLDVRPGNRKIVHHVIAYADPGGKSVALDERDPGPGYSCFGGPGFSISLSTSEILAGKAIMLGGWAPGSRGYFAPEGVGIKMAGAATDRVVLQVHYHPTGEPETDHTNVGFYFAKKPVSKSLLLLPLVNQTFTIPAGAKNHEVTASFDVPSLLTGKLVGVTPHMHLLGKQIKVEMTPPGGQPQCLVNIPSWDFNWQGSYLYKNAIAAGAGSRIKLTCIYDNSTDNPFQPNNPPKPVRWGEETTDEMALAFLAFTLDAFSIAPSSPQLAEVSLDPSGNLGVSGSGFQSGADIEINGRSLRDTTAPASNRLSSAQMWKVFAAPGQAVDVTVLNPDGIRTAALKFTRPGAARSAAAVSAASFSADALAPEAIAAAFGTGLATATMVAASTPLPTELAGTRVFVNGVAAPLFFVAPSQVNFLVPAGVSTGSAVVEITAGDNSVSRGTINLYLIAPSLFTSNAKGTDAPAAVVTKDGINFASVGNPDGTSNPLDAGDYLVLFGSGFRKASLNAVQITIGGRPAPARFAGPQGGLAGLDQINTQIPPGVSGLVDVVVSINGRAANLVKVRIR
jgi:uncharacterized protein (TIGR03437 family)